MKNQEHIKSLAALIQSRRSIFPASYTNQAIDKETIELILQAANYAPTHRKTEPWRFKVLQGDKLRELGEVLAQEYLNSNGDKASKFKHKKILNKPQLCSHVIAICMQRDPKESVPEWEEVAATAMAVQNMWLTATAHNIGTYWSSPKSIASTACQSFLQLSEGERCLGFFYMGHHEQEAQEADRQPIEEKTTWL